MPYSLSSLYLCSITPRRKRMEKIVDGPITDQLPNCSPTIKMPKSSQWQPSFMRSKTTLIRLVFLPSFFLLFYFALGCKNIMAHPIKNDLSSAEVRPSPTLCALHPDVCDTFRTERGCRSSMPLPLSLFLSSILL